MHALAQAMVGSAFVEAQHMLCAAASGKPAVRAEQRTSRSSARSCSALALKSLTLLPFSSSSCTFLCQMNLCRRVDVTVLRMDV